MNCYCINIKHYSCHKVKIIAVIYLILEQNVEVVNYFLKLQITLNWRKVHEIQYQTFSCVMMYKKCIVPISL